MKRRDKRILRKTIKFIEDEPITKKEKELRIKKITEILEITDRNEKYSRLYDELCDYLDNKCQEYNLCKFKNGICEKRRCVCKKDVPIYQNGCCYSTTRHENCKYLTDKGCSVRNIACKLFICGYIKKTRKVKFSLNKIYLSKYTLNFIQKVYLSSTFFTTKDVLLKGLLKRRNLYGF